MTHAPTIELDDPATATATPAARAIAPFGAPTPGAPGPDHAGRRRPLALIGGGLAALALLSAIAAIALHQRDAASPAVDAVASGAATGPVNTDRAFDSALSDLGRTRHRTADEPTATTPAAGPDATAPVPVASVPAGPPPTAPTVGGAGPPAGPSVGPASPASTPAPGPTPSGPQSGGSPGPAPGSTGASPAVIITSPQEAADGLVHAWLARDRAAAAPFGADSAVTELFAANPRPDGSTGPSPAYTFEGCEGAAGSTYCSYVGAGQRVVVQVTNGAGGTGFVVVSARVDPA